MSNDTEVKQKFSAAVGAVAGRDQVINNHNYGNVVETEKTELKELLTITQRGILNKKVLEAASKFGSRFESEDDAKKDLWNYIRAKLHHEKGIATWFRHDFERAESFIELWCSNFENEIKRSRLVGLLWKSPYKKILEEKALVLFGEKQFRNLKFDELQILAVENERLLGASEINTTTQDSEIIILKEELDAMGVLLNESRELTKRLQKINASLSIKRESDYIHIKYLRVAIIGLIIILVMLMFYFLVYLVY